MFMHKMEIFNSFSHFVWLKAVLNRVALTTVLTGFNHHAAKTLQP